MKPIKLIYVVFFWIFICVNVTAQLDIVDGATIPYNPTNLVRNVFLGSGVEVTSIQHQGSDRSVGYFTNGESRFGLQRGIVLATGFVDSLLLDNETFNDNGDQLFSGGASDPDLQAIAGDVIGDQSIYTIKFIPASDTLRFRYVFASEEYPEFICSINDVFGFFITGPNPEGGMYNSKNIAIVPEPGDPSGLTFTNIPVSINTVQGGDSGCPAQFPEYYNDVPLGTKFFSMNAYLDVFTAEAIVIPCQEYTIKLGVADASDLILNSAVFLEAKSFGTGSLNVELNSLSVDGSLAEGCGVGALEFSLPETVGEDYIIDIEFFTPSNSATPGLDYPEIPTQLIIPAGSNSVSVALEAFLDNEAEGDEVISFEIQVDICNRKKFEIVIRDDDLFAPILPQDTTLCLGDEYLLRSELDPDFILPLAPFFTNTDTIELSNDGEPYYSDIIVSGVIPTVIQPNIIESVCIIGLEHRDLTDFDIYLISPGEQILELSTDNGFKDNQISDVDRYDNTCFTPFAVTNVNNGANLSGPIFDLNPTYTGEFAPEGVWSDLWDGEYPTNGTWRLLIIDDTNGFTGILEGWSITFRSYYGLTYEWSSDPVSPICENCEDINVKPNVDTEYTLKIIDSYGCERSASTMVRVDPSLETPIPTCGLISENSLQVIWDEIADNEGYEIRIDGGTWVPVNSTNYTFLALISSSDFEIEVRAISDMCNSVEALLICRTLDCAQPLITVVVDDLVSCPGGNDGAATLSATGIAPFTFEVGGFSNNTGVFNNIMQGMTTYIVTDNTGCSIQDSFMMEGPQQFTFVPQFELSDPCNVISSISGSFQISGGTEPYNFLWSSGDTNPVAENLSPGLWTLTITDDNGCVAESELEIPDLEQFIFDVITDPPFCKDESNGSAQVEITSGVGPFSFAWEDGSSAIINENLGAGNYIVTVTDVLGCSESKFFTVDSGAEILLKITPTNTSCFGQADGSAIAEASGGVGPYSFLWSAGSAMDDETENLAAGIFTLMVTDQNGCSKTEEFTIEEPEGLSFEVSSIDNRCFGQANGIIELNNVSSPNGSVQVQWLDDGSTDLERMDLQNGEYIFTLDDGTICLFTDTVVISSPDEIQIVESINGPTCVDSEDGAISIDILGGTAPFDYEWLGPEGGLPSSAQLVDLKSGSYFLTLTDGNFCMIEQQYDISPPSPISVDSSVFVISCNGENTGQIFFSASGGTPPFSYNWTGPDGFEAITNNVLNVFAGVYTVSYSDNVGCSATYNFEITQPALPLKANITELDSVCFGFSNGQLSVNPSGGTGPYSILWNDGEDNFTNPGLSPGEYTVTVSDSRACIAVSNAEIRETKQIAVDLEQFPSSCFESNDGAANVITINYGDVESNLSNFDVLWNSNPSQSELLATGLTGGIEYTAVVTDEQGCRGEESIVISTPEPVDARILEIANVNCFGGSDGSLEISGVGGTGDYTYLWDVNANSMTTNSIRNLPRGNYNVTISDDNGCEGVRNFSIDEPRPLAMNLRTIDVSCFLGNDGRVEAVVNGGTPPYQYQWSHGGNAPAITELESDWYQVTVTDGNACSIIDSALVFQPDDPIMADFSVEDASCFGSTDGRINVSASGGSGFYGFSLDGNSYSSNDIFTSLSAGNYVVYINDFKGCVDTFSEVNIDQPSEIVVDLGEDLIIPFGSSTTINPSVFNISGNIEYDWKSANLELLSCTNCLNPTFDGQREASFELIITDMQGCQGSDFINIRLENFSPLSVPSAFTPNGDNENDILVLFGSGINIVNNFAIYDRWGELVFEMKDVEMNGALEAWDGLFKQENAPSGLYYWFAEVEFDNGFIENFKGNTTLLR